MSLISEKIKKKGEYNLKKINSISQDIREVEAFLKSSAFLYFELEIDDTSLIYWDEKRLGFLYDGVDRPLIEHAIEERILGHSYLLRFLDEIEEID